MNNNSDLRMFGLLHFVTAHAESASSLVISSEVRGSN